MFLDIVWEGEICLFLESMRIYANNSLFYKEKNVKWIFLRNWSI
jgi:hypothetical protein